MKLPERNEMGETLYQCDQCQMVGAKDSCIIEDNYQHLCMSCWCEKLRNRAPRQRRGEVVEI